MIVGNNCTTIFQSRLVMSEIEYTSILFPAIRVLGKVVMFSFSKTDLRCPQQIVSREKQCLSPKNKLRI